MTVETRTEQVEAEQVAASPCAFDGSDVSGRLDFDAIPRTVVESLPRNDAEEALLKKAHREKRDIENQSAIEDITLKRRYGNGLLIALAIQLLIMNAIFASVGVKWLQYEQWALHLYVSGTLLEIFALVLVVTKYLFPQSTSEPQKDSDTGNGA